MSRTIRNACVLLLVVSTTLSAQLEARLQVRTFILQHLTPDDAAALVAPYVDYTEGGGVFHAKALRGVTVRALPLVLARVDSLLRASDKAPASIRLRFQVVAAVDSTIPADPDLGGLEGELRSVLRYRGYRLLSQGVITTTDDHISQLTLGDGRSDLFLVQTHVQRIEPADKGSVRLTVSLQGWPWMAPTTSGHRSGTNVISTGLTLPMAQSVVVGSGAAKALPSGSNELRNYSILLVVRADPVGKP